MKTGPTICWTESHAVLVDQPVASVCICIYVFHNNYYGVIMTPSSVFTMCLCVCVSRVCVCARECLKQSEFVNLGLLRKLTLVVVGNSHECVV